MSRLSTHILNLLHWSERHTKTDMVHLARNGSWLLLSQVVTFCLSFGLLWCFTTFLSKESYGEYRFIITALGLLSLTTLPGTKAALTRATARGASGVLQPLVTARIKYGYIGSVIALTIAGYYAWQDNLHLASLFFIIAAAVPIFESYLLYEDYLNGLQQFKIAALLHIAQRTCTVLATATALILTQQVFFILLTYVITMIASFRIALWWTMRRFPPTDTTDTTALPHSKHLSLIGLIRGVTTHSDKLLLWYLIGPVAVAQMAVAQSIPTELTNGLSQISRLALPKLSNVSGVVHARLFLRKLLLLFGGVLLLVVIYIAAAPTLFTLLLPQYTDITTYSQLLALTSLGVPAVVLRNYFIAQQDNTALYLTHTIEPIITISLYLVLIPLYGVLGAVIAVISSTVVRSALLFGLFGWRYIRPH